MILLPTPKPALDTDGWIDPAAAQAAGFDVVGLYLNGNVTYDVIAAFTKLNMAIVSYWEHGASDPNGGASAGESDAAIAVDLAKSFRQPLGTGIMLPNDQMVLNWNSTVAYFQAGAKVINGEGYKPLFYGQMAVWNAIKQDFEYFIHAPDGTPSDQVPSSGCNIAQSWTPEGGNQGFNFIDVGGASCDNNTVFTYDFGGWDANGPWAFPSPVKPQEGNDMVAYDPKSGGFWTVNSAGAVNSYQGAPYLGGLNNHPEYKAGGAAINGPCTGIAPFGEGGNGGYVLVTQDAKGTVHPYQFARNGSLAK